MPRAHGLVFTGITPVFPEPVQVMFDDRLMLPKVRIKWPKMLKRNSYVWAMMTLIGHTSCLYKPDPNNINTITHDHTGGVYLSEQTNSGLP